MDTEAIAWAAQKLQAFGVDHSTMDNALMMDRLYEMLSAAPTPPEVEQATNCAVCSEYKHTPLRVGCMGGYVCLTCIDKEINKRPPEVEPVAWVSDSGNFYTKDSEYDLRAFTPLYTSPSSPKAEWDAEGEQSLPEDTEINLAHPLHTGRHDLYAEASRLVGAKRGKFALIKLVNWLLHKAENQSKAAWDAEGNPLNLEAAARDALDKLVSLKNRRLLGERDHRCIETLRKFLKDQS